MCCFVQIIGNAALYIKGVLTIGKRLRKRNMKNRRYPLFEMKVLDDLQDNGRAGNGSGK